MCVGGACWCNGTGVGGARETSKATVLIPAQAAILDLPYEMETKHSKEAQGEIWLCGKRAVLLHSLSVVPLEPDL